MSKHSKLIKHGFFALLVFASLALSNWAQAQAIPSNGSLLYPDYALQPRQIATDTWVIEGEVADFSRANGCNIINTGLITTPEGVLVINTGPSALYGQQLKEAVARLSDQPIVRILNLNLHPDYFFGNQAFESVPIQALAKTIAGEKAEADIYADNLYRICGNWMRGTEPSPAQEAIQAQSFSLGGHTLELIALSGHTDADLVVLDTSTGVMFAGGLVFSKRIPTTPHADIESWLASLKHLQSTVESLPVRVLVPSHGPVAIGQNQALEALTQTSDWLQWLEQSLNQAVAVGKDMSEVLQAQVPETFRDWAVLRPEYQRSVFHFYPEIEIRALQQTTP